MLKFSYIRGLYVFLFVGMMTLCWWTNNDWRWWSVGLGVTYLALVTYGSFNIQSNFFIEAIHKAKDGKALALTFDDGPSPITLEVLDVLRQYEVKATFFLIGQQVEKYPEIVQRLVNDGHQIGNHTFHHAHTTGFYSIDKLADEVELTNHAVMKITGLKMNLFRPPFGVTSPNLSKVVQRLKLSTIGWSVRSLDTTSRSAEQVVERVCKQVRSGGVILLHDNRDKTVVVLEKILPRLVKQYQFATVGELLNIKAYE